MARRYFFLIFLLAFFFAQFVSCGSQMYQTSLEEDSETHDIDDGAFDQNSQRYGIHALNGWKKRLPIVFYIGENFTKKQKIGLLFAVKTWELAIGQTIFHYLGVHNNISGQSFHDLFSSLDDSINGHYVHGDWDKTGKPRNVLATTIWDISPDNSEGIITADIRFNEQYYVVADSLSDHNEGDRQVVDMWSLSLHELGHWLGLSHIDSAYDPYSIMNPALFVGEGFVSRGLSKGDIKRIQKIYGCVGTACDVDSIYLEIENFVENPESKEENNNPES